SYCKRCGEWLPDTARLGRRRGRIRARTPEQRHQKMRIIEAMSALAALSSAVIILAALAGKIDRPTLLMAADLCFLTAIFQAINFVIGYSLQKRLKQGRDETDKTGILEARTERPQLNRADTSTLARAASSITESTTELLDAVPRVMERKK
ncbi:MAG TPA: hypothetical protein VKB86_05515, partial [Pyrinomonadaceae bacterium]|nr:hypothetical protein [Pyrinomonadaceae bacterium]